MVQECKRSVDPRKYPHLYAWQHALLYRAAWASIGVGFSSKAFSNWSRASLTYTGANKMTTECRYELYDYRRLFNKMIKIESTEEFAQTCSLLSKPVSEMYYGIVNTSRQYNNNITGIYLYQLADSFFSRVLIPVSSQLNTKAQITDSFQVGDYHNLPKHFILRLLIKQYQ